MNLWHALEIQSEDKAQDILVAYFQGRDITGIEERDSGTLVVYQSSPWSRALVSRELKALLGDVGVPAPRIEIFEVPEEDWLAEWKSHWKPLPLGKYLWVVPAWLGDDPVPGGRRVVNIEPGMAFGTGTHETTALAWGLLEDALGVTPPPDFFLELGLGTGLLSLGASLLVPHMTILATEGDPRALATIRANLLLNPTCRVLPVLTREVPVPRAWADLAVVNMTHGEHQGVREQLLPSLRKTSSLVLSGLFSQQAREQLEWWQPHGFQLVTIRDQGDWTALHLRRRSRG